MHQLKFYLFGTSYSFQTRRFKYKWEQKKCTYKCAKASNWQPKESRKKPKLKQRKGSPKQYKPTQYLAHPRLPSHFHLPFTHITSPTQIPKTMQLSTHTKMQVKRRNKAYPLERFRPHPLLTTPCPFQLGFCFCSLQSTNPDKRCNFDYITTTIITIIVNIYYSLFGILEK